LDIIFPLKDFGRKYSLVVWNSNKGSGGKETDLSGPSAQSLGCTELVMTTMLDAVLPAVFHFMQNGDEDMSMTS
jgi:hypothetical protein